MRSHFSWLKGNLTPANFSRLFSFGTIRRVFWQHWSREQWQSLFRADLGCAWTPKPGYRCCLLGSHSSHSASLCLDIKGKNWRTGSKLESLYRRGSLITLLLLEVFLELVFRVMCGRQEQYHLPLFLNWDQKNLTNPRIPSDRFGNAVLPGLWSQGGGWWWSTVCQPAASGRHEGTQACLPQCPPDPGPRVPGLTVPLPSLFHCFSPWRYPGWLQETHSHPSYTTVLPTSHMQISAHWAKSCTCCCRDWGHSSTARSQGRFAGSCQAQLVCPKGAVASICTLIYPALPRVISANSSQQCYEISWAVSPHFLQLRKPKLCEDWRPSPRAQEGSWDALPSSVAVEASHKSTAIEASPRVAWVLDEHDIVPETLFPIDCCLALVEELPSR